MRWTIAILAAAALAAPAAGRGLAGRDLSGLGAAAVAALGSGFEVKAERDRMTLLCADCAGKPIVDVSIGRQTDGTEGRVRSGQTKMADLERLCRERSPTCTIAALQVAPAVGWVSGYPMGDGAGATAVILRDGDLLTVRSLAGDAATARRSLDRLLPLLRSRIVGP